MASAVAAAGGVAAPAAPVATRKCFRCPQPGTLNCSRCKVAYYCSVACQKKDWQLEHKLRCKELREEAAAAAAKSGAANSKGTAGADGSPAPAPAASPSPSPEAEADVTAAMLRPPTRWLFPPSELPALQLAPPSAVLPARPVGLQNPKQANSCFMNVCLQTLTHTAPFAAWLDQAKHGAEGEPACAIRSAGKHCTLCTLSSHRQTVISRARSAASAKEAILPRELLLNLKALDADYRLGQQEDSQEAMRKLLETMDEQWRKDQEAKAAAQEAAASEDSAAAVPARSLSQRTLETSPLAQLFGGYTVKSLRCAEAGCQRSTFKFERFVDLQLELLEDATDELSDMLEAFSRREKQDKANAWGCSHCGQKTRATTQLSIFQQPNVLMVQPKRFRHGLFGKVNKYIHFPMQLQLTKYTAPMLRQAAETAAEATAAGSAVAAASDAAAAAPAPPSLSPSLSSSTSTTSPSGLPSLSTYLAGNDLSAPYVLYGVIVHVDLMNIASFGHYICYIRRPAALERALARAREDHAAGASYEAVDSQARRDDEGADDEWLRFDDDEITPVSAKEVQRQRAYILLYQRVTPWVSAPLVAEEEAPAAAASTSSSANGSGSADSAADDTPVQCVGGCGFWGKASQQNRCSKCYRDWQVSQGLAPPPQPKPAASSTARRAQDTQSEEMQQAVAMMMMRQRMMQAARQKAAVEQAAQLQAQASAKNGATDGRTYREIEALQQRVAEARLSDAKRAEAQAPPPAAAKAAPAPAAPAAAADAGAADNGAGGVPKLCSSCHEHQPSSCYSSAQLKKQGKRVCKPCVEKHATSAPAK